MKLEPLGDAAVVATLGSASDAPAMASALGLAERLVAARARGIVDVVAAYATVTAFYDPLQFLDPQEDAYDCVCRLIETCGARSAREPSAAGGGAVDIPVYKVKSLVPVVEMHEISAFWVTYRMPHRVLRRVSTTIAVNLGGALIPVAVPLRSRSTCSRPTPAPWCSTPWPPRS